MTGMKFDLSFAGDVSHKGHYSNMQHYPVALGDFRRGDVSLKNYALANCSNSKPFFFFHMTLGLTIMDHHIKFGYKSLELFRRYLLDKAGHVEWHTGRQTDEHGDSRITPPPPPVRVGISYLHHHVHLITTCKQKHAILESSNSHLPRACGKLEMMGP